MSTNKSFEVHYYAVFREQRGLSSEPLSSAASSLRDLYLELKRLHNFSLPIERVRVAVNDEFVQWDSSIPSGARIAFIPPVAGG